MRQIGSPRPLKNAKIGSPTPTPIESLYREEEGDSSSIPPFSNTGQANADITSGKVESESVAPPLTPEQYFALADYGECQAYYRGLSPDERKAFDKALHDYHEERKAREQEGILAWLNKGLGRSLDQSKSETAEVIKRFAAMSEGERENWLAWAKQQSDVVGFAMFPDRILRSLNKGLHMPYYGNTAHAL